MNIVGYLRVSTSKQEASGLGLEAQHADIFAYAERHGHNIVSWHTDAGVSGTSQLSERPALIQAVASVRTNGAEALVVSKLDRLSREPLVYLTIENLLGKLGASIVSTSGEGTQDDSPQSVLMRRILQAVAEQEAAVISQRIKSALAMKKARGERMGRPPYGTRLNDETDNLMPSADFANVERVMKLRSKNLSFAKIAVIMEAECDNDTWSHTKVRRIVKRWKSLRRVREFSDT
jgi:DNA invertase Pin-like site-specific DNA recombinase